jgi:hypothetical protein
MQGPAAAGCSAWAAWRIRVTNHAGDHADIALLTDGKPAIRWKQLDGLLCDDLTFYGETISNIEYSRSGFKSAKFRQINFVRCSFTNCYFRQAEFRSTGFINCTFTDCIFDDASFIDTRLHYSEFRNCRISFIQLHGCLLAHPENIRRDLARSLMTNAANRGLSDDARAFLLLQLSASERFYRLKALPEPNDWYDRHYPGLTNRLDGLGRWLWLLFNRWVWGHGEQPWRVLLSSLVVIVAFALLLYIPGFGVSNLSGGFGIADHLGFSTANFVSANYGDIIPANLATRIVAVFEGALGLLFFGLLVTSFYRWISQR